MELQPQSNYRYYDVNTGVNKRQYKNVADIMTYDDLLTRLDNIIKALQASVNTSGIDDGAKGKLPKVSKGSSAAYSI